jgi:hypothetical protein
MELLVDGLQAGAIHMGVVLGGGDVSVAQQFLHYAQIGSAFQ